MLIIILPWARSVQSRTWASVCGTVLVMMRGKERSDRFLGFSQWYLYVSDHVHFSVLIQKKSIVPKHPQIFTEFK